MCSNCSSCLRPRATLRGTHDLPTSTHLIHARLSRCHASTGYNELVIESATWVRNLPDAVEAIFVVECDGSRRNTAYAASRTCEQARAKARQVHAAYLAKTGRASSGFPLLRLRPDNWAEPFVSDC